MMQQNLAIMAKTIPSMMQNAKTSRLAVSLNFVVISTSKSALIKSSAERKDFSMVIKPPSNVQILRRSTLSARRNSSKSLASIREIMYIETTNAAKDQHAPNGPCSEISSKDVLKSVSVVRKANSMDMIPNSIVFHRINRSKELLLHAASMKIVKKIKTDVQHGRIQLEKSSQNVSLQSSVIEEQLTIP